MSRNLKLILQQMSKSLRTLCAYKSPSRLEKCKGWRSARLIKEARLNSFNTSLNQRQADEKIRAWLVSLWNNDGVFSIESKMLWMNWSRTRTNHLRIDVCVCVCLWMWEELKLLGFRFADAFIMDWLIPNNDQNCVLFVLRPIMPF